MMRRSRPARRASLGRAAAAALMLALAAPIHFGAAFAQPDDSPVGKRTGRLPKIPIDRPATTTVYVVRHAETAPDGTPNPPLSEAGVARARALREDLQRSGIRAIFATPYRRTQATGQQLAALLKLPVQTYEARAESALAVRIREHFAGRAVLVIGHSNTVPRLVRALGGPAYADLGHDEYDALFVVQVKPETTLVSRLRYGAASNATRSP